ncbi:hypothetical protein [Shimazuella kribbensis]|uniref:hypothetical protein n=1 Tax=Shimazuella kribbensis TaxID=139808 RepID=UPI00040EE540|nr:hypothetical protein [Shimazuella kribbensis]
MIQLQVTGQTAEVQAFVQYLGEQPYFEVVEQEEEKGYEYFSLRCEVTTNLLKPSLRTLHKVHLVTPDRKNVVIELLDAKVQKVGSSVTITGRNYDIFS